LINCFGLPAAKMRIHAHLISHPSAEQLVNGYPKGFSQDVTKGMLDAGDRGHTDDAETKIGMAIEDLPEEVDAGRIAADQHGLEILDAPHNGARLPLQRSFAPAVQAGNVCLHFHKNPVAHARIDHNRTDVDYLHGSEISISMRGHIPARAVRMCGREQ